jgi:tetratricopeptide (TPR) repeat protein
MQMERELDRLLFYELHWLRIDEVTTIDEYVYKNERVTDILTNIVNAPEADVPRDGTMYKYALDCSNIITIRQKHAHLFPIDRVVVPPNDDEPGRNKLQYLCISAGALEVVEKYDEAVTAYDELLEILPDCLWALKCKNDCIEKLSQKLQSYILPAEPLEPTGINDILQAEYESLSVNVRNKLDEAEELLKDADSDESALRQAIETADEAITLNGGSLSAARVIKANAYLELEEMGEAYDSMSLAFEENPDEFNAVWFLTLAVVHNCEDIALEETGTKKRGLLGKAISGTYSQRARQMIMESLTVVDDLIELYERLASSGLYGWRYIDFSDNMLRIADAIIENQLPHQAKRLALAVLNVPDSQIYFHNENIAAMVDELRRNARKYI